MSDADSKSDSGLQREMTNFSNHLKQYGLKITNQRLLVAEKIFRMNTHFTVDSLAEELREQRDRISRATIYRIVSLLVESGQLIEHKFDSSMKVYEYARNRQHHDHIVCMDCGRIDEFVDERIEKVQVNMARRLGYRLEDHAMILHGRCKEFQENGSCKRARRPDR